MPLDFGLLGSSDQRINTPFENLDVVLRARAAQEAARGLAEQRQGLAEKRRAEAELARQEAQQTAQFKALWNRTDPATGQPVMPTMEEATQDHNAGGAMIGIEVPSHLNKLEATFNLAGWDPDIMTYIGRETRFFQIFTAYGLIRDRRSGDALQATARMQGRLGRVNPTSFSKGNLMHHEYSIKSIVSYQLTMQIVANGNPNEIYYWDFFTSERRVGGFDLNKDLVNLLKIPGIATDTADTVGSVA